MSFYPTVEELLKGENPERLLEMRRSMRSVAKRICYFVASLIAVIVLNVVFYDSHVSLRFFALIPVAILIDIFRRYNDDLYVIGRDRITHYQGRLSFNYVVPSVRYTDIRAINVSQDVFGRILDYGDVRVGTAGKDGYELSLDGIRRPDEASKLLDLLRSSSIKESIASENSLNSTAAQSVNSD